MGGAVQEGARRALTGASLDPMELLLTPANARALAARLSEMRGAAMKIGQLLSMEASQLLPRELSAALGMLRADAHQMPMSQLVDVLGREYGRGWEQRFRRFSFTPLAAASIGQVHRAQTRDGRDLALKVQYPGVARSIDSDIDNLAMLLRLLVPRGLDIAPLLAEAKAQLQREADYRLEAEMLRHYAQLLGTDPDFIVPGVHSDLSTDHILAMDYIEGEPIDALAVGSSQEILDRAGTRLVRLLLREMFAFGFMQTDPNFANFLHATASGRIALLDLGAARPLATELVQGYALLAEALLHGRLDLVPAAAERLGYLREQDSAAERQAMTDLMWLASEPIRSAGPYDFAASTLAARVSDRAQDLFLRQGFTTTPPPSTMFIHRKVVGIFFLCARLGARVDVSALLREALAETGDEASTA